MLRLVKRCAALFAAALLLVCLPAASILAEGAPYTYTVRFYSGQQGTFADGRQVLVYKDLSYGSIVSFNQGGVVLNDGSKYYVRGIRESGRDNNTVSAITWWHMDCGEIWLRIPSIMWTKAGRRWRLPILITVTWETNPSLPFCTLTDTSPRHTT